MAHESPLQGGCSCGRNEYLIFNSLLADGSLQLVLHDEIASGKFVISRLWSPLLTKNAGSAPSLRIPLSNIRSTTHAYYPDETHNAIRRVFTPRHAPHTKRHFCGFCGTPLTYWSEGPQGEAEWVYVSLSSLRSRSVEALETAGFLSGNTEVDENTNTANISHSRELRGTPWFEEMIDGSELGRMKRKRGGQTSADGKTKVRWEIVEFEGDDGEIEFAGGEKRKLDQVGDGDDLVMRTG